MSKMKDEIRDILHKLATGGFLSGSCDTDKAVDKAIDCIEANYIPKERVLTRDEIMGVLARGYCTKRNRYKVSDPDLIADQVYALLKAGSIEKVGVEDIEKIADDIFRDYYVPLYSKDKPLREMTSYETGVYRTTQMVVSMTIQAILSNLKEKE